MRRMKKAIAIALATATMTSQDNDGDGSRVETKRDWILVSGR